MDLEKIKLLIDAMTASDLAEMEFSEGGWSLRLVRRKHDVGEPQPAAPKSVARSRRPVEKTAAASDASRDDQILSPTFGAVYLRPSPDAPEFVSPGKQVVTGDILCVVEAMKVFNEVRATRDGVIAAVLVASGDEVETGQVLMRFA
jgi:acetyl-CoA carboxylase biotin carboxyl carrier protein